MKTKRKNSALWHTKWLLTLALLLPMAASPMHIQTKEAQNMILLNHSLWQLVERLANSHPLTLEKAELALGQPLIEKGEQSNPFYTSYTGKPIALNNSLSIHDIELRLNNDPSRPNTSVLVFYVQGTCINLQTLEQHYPKLAITDTPRGRSENEATTHTSQQSWGQLHFGFQVKNPSCLGYVSFIGKGS